MDNLKPLQQELAKLQKELSDNQRKWRSEKNSLVREVSGLKAKKANLEDKNSNLDELIAQKQVSIDGLDKSIIATELEIADRKRQIDDLDIHRGRQKAKIAKLDKSIESKQKELEGGLKDYEDRRKSEVEAELTNKNTELISLQASVDESQTELESIIQQIGDGKQQVADLVTGLNDEKIRLNTELADNRQKAAEIGQNIEGLEDLKDKLQNEVKELQYARGEAISATNKAIIQHEQFVKYEQKARAALDAKDKSLQEREDEVEKSSVLMRNARSNLPAM